MTTEELVKYLGNLSVLELLALTKTLDDMWEITDRGAPCPMVFPTLPVGYLETMQAEQEKLKNGDPR